MGKPSAVFQYLSFCQCRWTIYRTAVPLRTYSGTNTSSGMGAPKMQKHLLRRQAGLTKAGQIRPTRL